MGSLTDLTTLANAKQWMQIDAADTSMDAVIQRQISAQSQIVLDYLQRDSFVSRTMTDVYDGSGGYVQFVREWPLTGVTTVLVDNIPYTLVPPDTGGVQTAPNRWGYRFAQFAGYPPGDPGRIESIGGWRFCGGKQNVSITYTAGYLISDEAATIPAQTTTPPDPPAPTDFQVTVSQPKGGWIADNGVKYSDPLIGGALALVTGTPTVGQYALVPSSAGTYQFSVDDVGNQVLISYSYCPFSVEQVVLNLISAQFAGRTRMGTKSRTLGGGETATYERVNVRTYADELQSYRNVLPL